MDRGNDGTRGRGMHGVHGHGGKYKYSVKATANLHQD